MTVRSIALTLEALATASTVSAEDADWYRGGWRADTDAPEVYQFDGTTLAPLEGTFDNDKGIAFTIRTQPRRLGRLDRLPAAQPNLPDDGYCGARSIRICSTSILPALSAVCLISSAARR